MAQRLFILALLLSVTIATSDCFAQRRGRPGGPDGREGGPGRGEPAGMLRSLPLFAALDADEDGELSADEIANASKALATLDKDDDGKLSREELAPRFGRGGGPGGPGLGRAGRERGEGRPGAGNRRRGNRSPEEMVTRLMQNDKNGDGKLDKNELPERMQARFDRMDEDGDGTLTKEELADAAQSFSRGQRGAGRERAAGEGRRRRQRPAAE